MIFLFSNIKKLAGMIFLVGLLIISTACSKEAIQKEELSESTISVLKLQSLEEMTLDYTEKSVFSTYSELNNISYFITEYYNKNNNTHHYVLTLKEVPFSNPNNDMVAFNVIKLSFGAKSNTAKKIFEKTATSPIYTSYDNVKIADGNYYLFKSNNKIQKNDFRIEAFLTNKEAYIENNEEISPGDSTYRFLYDKKESFSIIYD